MESVSLKYKKQFKDILDTYEVSEHAKKILRDINYVILIGPAAAGRNTIIEQLVIKYNFMQVVSDTTRPPKIRDGKKEIHGENYYFRDEDSFLKDLENGEFLEAELIHDQQVSGTSIRELEKIKNKDSIGINEVEFGGAKNVLKVKPDTTVIAILPSSFEIWQERFAKREKISRKEFMNRIKTASEVIELIESDERIKVVINHDFHEAAMIIDAIVNTDYKNEGQLEEIQKVVEDFKSNIKLLLKNN